MVEDKYPYKCGMPNCRNNVKLPNGMCTECLKDFELESRAEKKMELQELEAQGYPEHSFW